MRQQFLVKTTSGAEFKVYADDYSITPQGFVLFLQEAGVQIAGTQPAVMPVCAFATGALESIITLDSAGRPLHERSGSVLAATSMPISTAN